MSEVDRQIARSNELLDRARQQAKPKSKSVIGRAARATKYAILGAGAVLLGAFVWGLITPLGTTGVMITFLAMLATMCLGVLLSREPDVSFDTLKQTDLKQLPHSTARWLDGQHKLLPAPAQSLADAIGIKLDTLAPQLQNLDPREPAAAEVRRLIADELPELINGYHRVPANLRRDGINGMSPDKQLVDGLSVVDSELARMSQQLATGDLNKLATQGRYLELKYQGES